MDNFKISLSRWNNWSTLHHFSRWARIQCLKDKKIGKELFQPFYLSKRERSFLFFLKQVSRNKFKLCYPPLPLTSFFESIASNTRSQPTTRSLSESSPVNTRSQKSAARGEDVQFITSTSPRAFPLPYSSINHRENSAATKRSNHSE